MHLCHQLCSHLLPCIKNRLGRRGTIFTAHRTLRNDGRRHLGCLLHDACAPLLTFFVQFSHQLRLHLLLRTLHCLGRCTQLRGRSRGRLTCCACLLALRCARRSSTLHRRLQVAGSEGRGARSLQNLLTLRRACDVSAVNSRRELRGRCLVRLVRIVAGARRRRRLQRHGSARLRLICPPFSCRKPLSIVCRRGNFSGTRRRAQRLEASKGRGLALLRLCGRRPLHLICTPLLLQSLVSDAKLFA